MDEPQVPLSLAFLRSRPQAAARTLEALPLEQVSPFLNELPAEYASLALGKMLPRIASKHLATFGAEKAAVILSPLEATRIAAILRPVENSIQEGVLKALPSDRRRACKAVLRYDEDSVGAWTVSECATLASDLTAQCARDTLGSAANVSCQDRFFAIDRENRLIGEIQAVELLAAPPSRTIEALASKGIPWLTARTSLQAASESKLWQGRDLMPILDPNQRFTGVLRHSDLREALSRGILKTTTDLSNQLAPTLLEDYAKVLWTLMMSLLGEYTPRTQPRNQSPQ